MPSLLAQHLANKVLELGSDVATDFHILARTLGVSLPDGFMLERVFRLVQHGTISVGRARELTDIIFSGRALSPEDLPEVKGELSMEDVPVEVINQLLGIVEQRDKTIQEMSAKIEALENHRLPAEVQESNQMAWEVTMLNTQLDSWKVPDRDGEDLWTLLGRIRWLKEHLEKMPKHEAVTKAWQKVVQEAGISIIGRRKYLCLTEAHCMELGLVMEALGWVNTEPE